jgi:hypothetical protein
MFELYVKKGNGYFSRLRYFYKKRKVGVFTPTFLVFKSLAAS